MDKKGRNRRGERDHGEKRGRWFPVYIVCYMEWEEQGVGLITAQAPEKKRKKEGQFPFCIWLLGKGQSLGEKNTFIFP